MPAADQTADCDVLVAGSGVAGLAAAVSAAHHGASVIVAESEPLLGGTTARTAGSLWLPCNRLAAARGIEDSPEKVRTYLRAVCRHRYDAARIDAFIENAPRALDFFLDHTTLRLFCPVAGSDYHPELPGGLDVGRSLYTEPFDGRLLGEHFGTLASPPAVHTVMGMVPQLGRDVLHFLRANRSTASARYVLKRLSRHSWERLRHGRAVTLTNGTALAARLLKSALDLGVRFRLSSPVVELEMVEGRVAGAVLDTPSGRARVGTRKGVVLACGGASHDASFRARYFASPLNAHRYRAATAAGSRGAGLRLAQAVGARLDDDMQAPAAWSPLSLVPTRAGPEVLPLFGGRASPGVIAVTRAGTRFVNEADDYHGFGTALIAATGEREEASAFLLCDSVAFRRYGLGYARPFPVPHHRHLASGYLLRGDTLADLAKAAGIDAQRLEATIAAVNRDALVGLDSEFGKGASPYNRRMGDDLHKPNPCIAPIATPPFYAIRIVVGDIGTYIGLATDAQARVLDHEGRPIPGLHAAGNDMASIFCGADPAGGTMLGPGLTFGFVAGRSLASV